MKIKEQLELSRELQTRYKDAMTSLVLQRVAWSGPKFVAPIPGMPAHKIRIGMMDTSEPRVIVHHMDSLEVFVITPDQIAEWPWPVVAEFPGLEEFLREHIGLAGPINIHVPGHAWIRKATEVKA
jgi:hypothetical protein